MIFTTSPLSIFTILAAASCLVSPSVGNINTVCELGQVCRQAKEPNAIVHVSENETSAILILPEFTVFAAHDDAGAALDDSPSTGLLKQAIQSIQEYLANPSDRAPQQKDLEELLEDLGDQLRESSDKAQEFYFLGGWPLLATLVSTSSHPKDRDNTDLHDKILAIRAQAAGAMGSAVKDRQQFGPWVLEEIQLDGDATTTTPLSLVVQALLEVSNVAATPGVHGDDTFAYQELMAKQTLFALESFLHVNQQAQAVFATMSTSPAKVLGLQAAVWVQEAVTTAATVSPNAPMSRHAIMMTTRLLAMANDIVVESDGNNKELVDVFSTDDWQRAAAMGATLSPSSSFKRMVFSPLQCQALQAMTSFGLAAKAPRVSMATHNLHEEL